MYEIRTIARNRSIVAEDWNAGSDGLIHAKNGTQTVESVPRENVAGVRPV